MILSRGIEKSFTNRICKYLDGAMNKSTLSIIATDGEQQIEQVELEICSNSFDPLLTTTFRPLIEQPQTT